ncbi:hypothetical protein GLW03_05975 [Halobacillus halophilus]|uniref:four-helix bundle copper-binding protein n=1 Tax=Halobacillus TaxID=45667 RepID=UPI00136E04CE|nr:MULTISPECIES: four-helix bundle copper-binding protein [Halobacillus]MCA1020902.1 four-helix bundle copper-binding protein [Halobacillus litoralis]MYL29360.1 hypothetical protein [Halobacillus halophilus]
MKKGAYLMEKTNVLEECMNAYKYAVEVVQKNSPLSRDLTQSCAEVCRSCANECLKLGESRSGRTYKMCLDYAELCEELEQDIQEDPGRLRKLV